MKSHALRRGAAESCLASSDSEAPASWYEAGAGSLPGGRTIRYCLTTSQLYAPRPAVMLLKAKVNSSPRMPEKVTCALAAP